VRAGYQAADKTALPGPIIPAQVGTAFGNYSTSIFNGSGGGSVSDFLARVQAASAAQ